MENRIPFHINDLSSTRAIAVRLNRPLRFRLLRRGKDIAGDGALNSRARAGVLHRRSNLLHHPPPLLAALAGHGDFAGGDDHEAHGLALGGLQMGIERLDGSEAEVVVSALQGHPEEMANALGVAPSPPLSGQRVALDEGFERLAVMPDGGEGLLLAFGAFER